MPVFNKWESFALAIIAMRYPENTFRIRAGSPRINGEPHGQPGWVADYGVYVLDPSAKANCGDLRCIVEVGSLSTPDKLKVWEEKFPGVEIWWLPKSQILQYVFPEFRKYYFVPDSGTETLTLLATEIVKLHTEAKAMTGWIRATVTALRGLVRDYKKTVQGVSEQLQAYVSCLESNLTGVDAETMSVLGAFDAEMAVWEASHENGADAVTRSNRDLEFHP